MNRLKGKYNLEEGYNLKAAKIIKPVIGNIPLAVVGGMRSVDFMSNTIDQNDADFISMSRPFIREPFIVKKFEKGTADKVSCVSCNRCLAAVPINIPIRCYHKKFPGK